MVAARQGFPRSSRLLKPADYRAVFSQAQRVSDSYLTVLFTPGDCSEARLGLAVSRRAVPRAVDRNRIKRQVRESFRLRRDRLAAIDIVFLARPPSRTASAGDLRQSLERLWQRVEKRCVGSSSC